jgi:hypothetical protein
MREEGWSDRIKGKRDGISDCGHKGITLESSVETEKPMILPSDFRGNLDLLTPSF